MDFSPTDLRLGDPEAEPEARIFVRVVYLEDGPRKHQWEMKKWSGEGKKVNRGALLWAPETQSHWEPSEGLVVSTRAVRKLQYLPINPSCTSSH